MEIKFYQVDAFANDVFKGNPAGICLLDNWLAESVMQAIAAENNLSETAFLVAEQKGYRIRWFTPAVEVDLCGHATLATAHVLFNHAGFKEQKISFNSRSGNLLVKKDGDKIVLDFPSKKPEPCQQPRGLDQILGVAATEVLCTGELMVVLADQEQVEQLKPDMAAIAGLDFRAVMVTAPGENCDFVSRFFAPKYGIPEDPVTGSAHTTLIPYWSDKLAKKDLHALQVSKRGGELFCQDLGSRVLIAGKAVTYLTGTINV